MLDKKDLIRVVKSPDSEPEVNYSIDFTSKKSGRGAYICKNLDCLEKAQKTRGLERSFKGAIPKDMYENLKNELMLSNEQTE